MDYITISVQTIIIIIHTLYKNSLRLYDVPHVRLSGRCAAAASVRMTQAFKCRDHPDLYQSYR